MELASKGGGLRTISIKKSRNWKSDVFLPVANRFHDDQAEEYDLEYETWYPALKMSPLITQSVYRGDIKITQYIHDGNYSAIKLSLRNKRFIFNRKVTYIAKAHIQSSIPGVCLYDQFDKWSVFFLGTRVFKLRTRLTVDINEDQE